MSCKPRAFSLEHLGQSATHEVYTFVVYPQLASDAIAQAEYRQALRGYLARAQPAGRGLWIACDVSRLSAGQILTLFYQVALPFMHAPIVTRVYGPFDKAIVTRQMYTPTRQLAENAFKHNWMPNLRAALPFDFAAHPNDHHLDRVVLG